MDLQVIQNKIFEVRGCRVMLDFHLAELYQVETRALKQAVKRNIGRFPSDFMFVLSKEEANLLLSIGVSQNVIPPDYNFGAALPMAFTEQGVAMLSSVLRSQTAIEVNISIMRAFVLMRQMVAGVISNFAPSKNSKVESSLMNKVLPIKRCSYLCIKQTNKAYEHRNKTEFHRETRYVVQS